MANVLRNAVIGCALAGTLVLGGGCAFAWPRASMSTRMPTAPRRAMPAYSGYAYAPGYASRWDYPAGYDTSGMAYSYRDLWRPGPNGTRCYPTLRAQNRC